MAKIKMGMSRLLSVAVLALGTVCVLGALQGRNPGRGSAALADTAQKNPFGLALQAKDLGIKKRIAVVKKFGVSYFRPSDIFVEKWKGSCEECQAAQKSGLQLVLTVRNNGWIGQPTTPPKNLRTYRQTLSKILAQYRPAILVVENEENSRLFYSGKPSEYRAQLRVACEAAHSQGLPCTNGGLSSNLAALLVYDSYRQKGDVAGARAFAQKAFEPWLRRMVAVPGDWRFIQKHQIEKGRAFLEAYKHAGIDYLNLHWHMADPEALGETARYLNRKTGLPLLTNEMGQQDLLPKTVEALMAKAAELKFPYIIWYSVDGQRSRSLVDAEGNLRSNGRALKALISKHSS